ncbi:hypothetical protein [Daejeonella sp.]|uniref:hypothetical protein n=1 Tax=Daejeonella sp. TaxID=2805397 RepID=UPI00272FDA78|nr:hypothetical protein [Daejeonella sp.]MDP2412467.1 hypothetical protein [Daejeonella sp.]
MKQNEIIKAISSNQQMRMMEKMMQTKDSTMYDMMYQMMDNSHMSQMMHGQKNMTTQDEMMMCPMHGNKKK